MRSNKLPINLRSNLHFSCVHLMKLTIYNKNLGEKNTPEILFQTRWYILRSDSVPFSLSTSPGRWISTFIANCFKSSKMLFEIEFSGVSNNTISCRNWKFVFRKIIMVHLNLYVDLFIMLFFTRFGTVYQKLNTRISWYILKIFVYNFQSLVSPYKSSVIDQIGSMWQTWRSKWTTIWRR